MGILPRRVGNARLQAAANRASTRSSLGCRGQPTDAATWVRPAPKGGDAHAVVGYVLDWWKRFQAESAA